MHCTYNVAFQLLLSMEQLTAVTEQSLIKLLQGMPQKVEVVEWVR